MPKRVLSIMDVKTTEGPWCQYLWNAGCLWEVGEVNAGAGSASLATSTDPAREESDWEGTEVCPLHYTLRWIPRILPSIGNTGMWQFR